MHTNSSPAKTNPTFTSFQEFWPFYISQHLNLTCRVLHYIGTTIGLITAIYFISQQHYTFIPLGFIPAYALAWIGHFVFEKNKPATFKYPFWSFRGDFVMLYYFVTRKIKTEIQKPEVLAFAKQ